MDIEIFETGNGGDSRMNGNDIGVMFGYENMPYLSIFGGGDWWGNDLLLTDAPDSKFNATTEKVLSSVALNSAGRIVIENAIKSDLAYIKKNVLETIIDVTATIANTDRLEIMINIDGKAFYYQWNPSEVYKNYTV